MRLSNIISRGAVHELLTYFKYTF